MHLPVLVSQVLQLSEHSIPQVPVEDRVKPDKHFVHFEELEQSWQLFEQATQVLDDTKYPLVHDEHLPEEQVLQLASHGTVQAPELNL